MNRFLCLGSNSLKILVLLTLLQQLLVAASTPLLANLIESVAKAEPFINGLISVGIIIVAPILPAFVIPYFLDKWKNDIIKDVVTEFQYNCSNKPGLWINKEKKARATAFLTHELFNVSATTSYYLTDALALILNAFLSIAAIVVFIDYRLLPGYLISVAIVFVGYVFLEKKLASLSKNSQDARVAFNSTLSNAWDNVVLGNKHNANSWKHYFHVTYRNNRTQELKKTLFTSASSQCCTLLSILPIVATVAYLVHVNFGDTGEIAKLLSTLPRQMLIISHLYVLANTLYQYPLIKAEMDNFVDVLQEQRVVVDKNKIDLSAITLSKRDKHGSATQASDWSSLLQVVQANVGRYSLSGANGTGKSHLLVWLKEHLQDSVLLPAQSDLLLQGEKQHFSSGQRAMQLLDEVVKNSYRYILLDEWDANLDEQNRLTLDKKLDEVALSKTVIEVRHAR